MSNRNELGADGVVRLVLRSLFALLLAGWTVGTIVEGRNLYEAYERRHVAAFSEEVGRLRARCPSDIANLAEQHADDISRVGFEQNFSRWRVELQSSYEAETRSWEERRARRTGVNVYDPSPRSPEDTIARCNSAIHIVANFRSINGYDPVGQILKYLSELLVFFILVAVVSLAAFKAVDWHHRTHGLTQRKWQRVFLVSVPLLWVILLLSAQPEGLIWGPIFLTWGVMVPAMTYVLAWLFMQHLMPWIKKGNPS